MTRQIRDGDILMRCNECCIWDFQDDFLIDLETESASCPSCNNNAKIIDMETIYIDTALMAKFEKSLTHNS